MDKVHVRIKKEIAEKGCGFVDIDGRQEIFPPRKNKKPVADHVFEVNETSFIKKKIGTGELIVVKREEKEGKEETYQVELNGKKIAELQVKSNIPRKEIKGMSLELPEVAEALGDAKIKNVEVTDNAVIIETK